jgi:hypothetical protein
MTSGPAHAATTLDAWRWDRVDVAQHESGGIFDGSANISVTGTIAVLGPTMNTSVLVRKRTTVGTRHGRGRMYTPGFWPANGDILSGSTLTSDALGVLQPRWSAFLTNLTEHTPIDTPVILPATGGSGPYPLIIGLEVESTLATQRKRMR